MDYLNVRRTVRSMYSATANQVTEDLPRDAAASIIDEILAKADARREQCLVEDRDLVKRASATLEAMFERMSGALLGDRLDKMFAATRARQKRTLSRSGNLSLGGALAAMAANDDLLTLYPHDHRALLYLMNLLAEARAELHAALGALVRRSHRRADWQYPDGLDGWQSVATGGRPTTGRREIPPPVGLLPERRSLTLTAPHGPDSSGVPLAA